MGTLEFNPRHPEGTQVDFKVLPGEGAVSGQMTDFLPGVFRKWVVRAGKKDRDSLLGRTAIPTLPACIPTRAGAQREAAHGGQMERGSPA